MIGKNLKRKLCFYCKYEISKHNKSNQLVKYNGKSKEICRNCNKNKHKPLKNEYENHDIQCKVCYKPVMFKKCISCSICNHFYHGKCLNLNKQDILKIESINNFYICHVCCYSILPINYVSDQEHKPKKTQPVLKQCFTCKTNVEKDKYPNKHIIYDGNLTSLCMKCSKLGLSIPVRNTGAVEFQDCSICEKLVRYEALICDGCQHLVHPYCNGISKRELDDLSKIPDTWYCITCNLKIYPNYLLKTNNRNMLAASTHDKLQLKKQFETYDDCSVCFKKVTGCETLACSSCNHWLHKNCIGKFKTRQEYQTFLKYYSNRQWDCPICRSEQLPFILLNDEDFYYTVLELSQRPTYINKENFQNVFMQLKDSEFFTMPYNCEIEDDKYLENIDPDNNFKMNDTCDYIIDSDKIVVKSPKDLAMMTLNIRSIRKNFQYFTDLLSSIKSKIHIICLNETWLGPLDNIEDFQIEGYHTPLCQNREGNFGGGVITYIHKDIEKFKYLKKFSFSDSYNHCLATEVNINNKVTIFLNVYRSPHNLNELFPELFNNIIEKLKSSTCFILGDTNYNLLNLKYHNPTEEYHNNLIAASFKPLIWKPTRVTEHSSTLIDHIWTNDLRHTSIMKSSIIVTDITDHLPCITVLTNPELNLSGYKYVTHRIINDENMLKFQKRIDDTKHALAFHVKNRHETNIDSKFTDYFDHLSRIYNDCFPIVTKKVHIKSFCKPWITAAVQKLIDKKNKNFCIKKKNNNEKNRQKYKRSKIIMETAIGIEKDKYYQNIITNINNCNKKRWDAMRIIINRKKLNKAPCVIPSDILGKHYENVAPKLAMELPEMKLDDIPSTSKNNAKIPKTDKKFEFKAIQEREIYENILKLDINKGPGKDDLDIKSLKAIAHIIAPHLSLLFNQFINDGIYPQYLKTAKCIPIYKGSPLDPLLAVSYRPISILAAINKVFERSLHKQLSEYLEENKLLPRFQYGYRKQHNTSQAILDFSEYIKQQLNNKEITIAIFMDLSKAFDTVDKHILEHKLTALGICSQSKSLISNYVSNRNFCINNNDVLYKLKHGVPQGSILGPLLFIMYTFDITNVTKKNKVIVYADDTTVLISGKSLTEVKQHCNDILTRFYNYFTLNKLSINASKTKYMVYKPQLRGKNRKQLHDSSNCKIEMNGFPLEQVQTIKFLGVVMNDSLTWNNHHQYIYRKVCKSLGIIYKCLGVLNEKESINMYKAFIQPYFLYAIEVWGHSIQSSNSTLVKLQSKVLRILYNYKRSEDAWRYNSGRILTLNELYMKVIQKLCLKHHMGMLPSYFTNNTMPNMNDDQLEKRITRISLEKMYDYKINIRDSKSYFIENCIKLWNLLPFEIKMLPYTNTSSAINVFNKGLPA